MVSGARSGEASALAVMAFVCPALSKTRDAARRSVKYFINPSLEV